MANAHGTSPRTPPIEVIVEGCPGPRRVAKTVRVSGGGGRVGQEPPIQPESCTQTSLWPCGGLSYAVKDADHDDDLPANRR